MSIKNLLNTVKVSKPNRNVFDLTHDVKLTMNMGDLVPTMAIECVPGDKFEISGETMTRFAPLVAPPMHRYDVTLHYWFVPNRIIWDHWREFITQEKVSGTIPAFPTYSYGAAQYTPLLDYMGLPVPIGGEAEKVSVLPFAAYQAIYNEYYRDQNLVPQIDYKAKDGDNNWSNTELFKLRKRAWEHDYFTSALPFAQKGNPVSVPVGGFNDVPLIANPVGGGTTGLNIDVHNQPGNISSAIAVTQDETLPDGTIYADTSQLVQASTTINDLRRAYKLQAWLEKAARGGSRYVEQIKAHFGVKSSDARLQRPEYITGVKSPVIISEVLNTGNETLPQGNQSGHGIAVTGGKQGTYYCEEHGYIIGIMSVMPKTAYQQGIPKHFLKHTDAFQYYWPDFANIGEQPIENRELYAFQGTAGNNTFGYTPRYSEYKFMPNRVAGDFRDTLDFWHSGRIFANAPQLNKEFIECVPDDRIFAVTDPTEHKLYCHVLNKVRAVRPMPIYGTPQF